MGRKVEMPKESLAPAYFVQYAALWSLLLAFFITILTMGKTKNSEFKSGVGFIRDAFGMKGGLGMLPFWRKASSSQSDEASPIQTPESEEPGDLIGFVKGLLWKEGLSSISILRTEVDDRGVNVMLKTPIVFPPGSALLNQDTQKFLNQMGGIFYNLPKTVISINCLTMDSGSEERDLFLASERAAAVARYLKETCRIPGSRIDAVGYSHARYLGALGSNVVDQAVLFSIRKVNKVKDKAKSISELTPG